MRSRWFGTIVIVAMSLVAFGVAARSIFLNGTRIDGVTNQKFDNCSVTIDANGDVFIEAKEYAVKNLDENAPKHKPKMKTTPTGPGKRYWLVKDENYPGKTQYDVDIYINSVWFKRLRADGEQVAKEITEKLRLGPNVIHFAAIKNIGQQRKSFSPQVFMRIIVGEGNVGGNNVMIENPLIQYKRTANETANFNDEYTIVVR